MDSVGLFLRYLVNDLLQALDAWLGEGSDSVLANAVDVQTTDPG
jgi:hypothetical protein